MTWIKAKSRDVHVSRKQLPTLTSTTTANSIPTPPLQHMAETSMTTTATENKRAEIRALYHVLQPLGLERYVYGMLAAGFRSWDDLRGITEDDMERLGMKLGHRRKLQRAIASIIGIPRDEPLSDWPLTPTTETDEEMYNDEILGHKNEAGKSGENRQSSLWIYTVEGRLVEVGNGGV